MMRTANPALHAGTFSETMMSPAASAAKVMTLQGTVFKTAVLLALCVATASYTWALTWEAVRGAEQGIGAGYSAVAPWIWGGLIGGLVFALITIFVKKAAPYTAPLYAGAEGLFLGAISAMFEAAFPGIVIQAVGLTFGVLAALLVAYTTRLIKPTENFKLGITAATGGIFLLYMLSWILRMFGTGIPFIHESGLIGIGFSLFVVVIAALNLVLDFDFIESAVEQGAPKHMEWYGAFGLIVTLVWLYLEILRLLAKLQSRD